VNHPDVADRRKERASYQIAAHAISRLCSLVLSAVLVNQIFDEVSVFEGVAERTGVHFDRAAVRRSTGLCRSLGELVRKARASGSGTFYLPVNLWPADTERVELNRPWVVMG
jgi:hypothetical protein